MNVSAHAGLVTRWRTSVARKELTPRVKIRNSVPGRQLWKFGLTKCLKNQPQTSPKPTPKRPPNDPKPTARPPSCIQNSPWRAGESRDRACAVTAFLILLLLSKDRALAPRASGAAAIPTSSEQPECGYTDERQAAGFRTNRIADLHVGHAADRRVGRIARAAGIAIDEEGPPRDVVAAGRGPVLEVVHNGLEAPAGDRKRRVTDDELFAVGADAPAIGRESGGVARIEIAARQIRVGRASALFRRTGR